MRKKDYYLVVNQRSKLTLLSDKLDISEIDALTLNYTKKEYTDYLLENGYLLDTTDFDLCIIKTFKTGNNLHEIKCYDCLFKIDTTIEVIHRCSLMFQQLALERAAKINTISQDLRIDTSPYFDEFCKIVFKNITSSNSKVLKVTKDSSIIDLEIRKALLEIKTVKSANHKLIFLKEKHLFNYKKLRGLFLEYLQVVFPNLKVIEEKELREKVKYSYNNLISETQVFDDKEDDEFYDLWRK